MGKSKARQRNIVSNALLFGLGLGAVFWALDAYFFGDGTLWHELFFPGKMELYMRTLVVILLVGFKLYLNQTQLLKDEIEARSRELEVAIQHVGASSMAKSDFLRNMSHEFRTPLNSIIGFSEQVLGDKAAPVSATQREHLGYVVESGQRLMGLIDDLLDFSQVGAGLMELQLGDFPLRDAIEGSLKIFRDRPGSKGIKLSVEVADDVGIVTADEKVIKHVLFNLLCNAIKFTPKGGLVGVRARRAGAEVEVMVWDTGPGIPESDLQKAFEPFQQFEDSLTKEHSGVGLGLKLCKSLVELHGGRIWVEGRAGGGSELYFSIPSVPHVGDAPAQESAKVYQ